MKTPKQLKTWGLIPGRLESSRLPKKALLKLHDLPMIVHVAKRSKLSKELDFVVVCTDSPEIASACFEHEINVCFTPSYCANGTERIYYAKRFLDIKTDEIIIDIQGDEPLLDPRSIDLVVKYSREAFSRGADIILPHVIGCPAGNKNVVKVVASGSRVVYLTRADAPYGFNRDSLLKKHLSTIGFTGRSLDSFAALLAPGELEDREGVELLRAIEGGLSIETFPIDADSFSVDVLEDFERADRALEKCAIFRQGYDR